MRRMRSFYTFHPWHSRRKAVSTVTESSAASIASSPTTLNSTGSSHTGDGYDISYRPEYHKTDSPYLLPKDDIEQSRLREQHAAYTDLMGGTVLHAPVVLPQKVLDIGCASGTATRELALRHVGAHVFGVDLCSFPNITPPLPANVAMIQGDIKTLLRPSLSIPGNNTGRANALEPGTFDYVFQRFLVCGMTGWPDYVTQCASALAPGGWLEMHEFDWVVTEASSSSNDSNGETGPERRDASQDWPWLQTLVEQARKRKGLDLLCGRSLAGWMRDAGLTEIVEKTYHPPMGLWQATRHPETRKMAEFFAKWWAGVHTILIENAMGLEGGEASAVGKAVVEGGGERREGGSIRELDEAEVADLDHAHELNLIRVRGMLDQMRRDFERAEVGRRIAWEVKVVYGRRPVNSGK